MRRALSYDPLKQRGLTLIELMVSVALSLVVLSALTYIYVGSRGAYRTNEALARVQENGRFALEWLTRDIRMAGYFGCASRANLNITVIAKNFTLGSPLDEAVHGYENGSGWTNPTTLTRVAGTDTISMSGMFQGALANVMDNDVVNNNFKIDQNCPKFAQNEVLMVTDCSRAHVFRVTNNTQFTCPASNSQPVLTTGATGNDNSAAPCPGNTLICPSYSQNARAFIARYEQMHYFIGVNPAGRPALYRVSIAGGAEEVAENIEDMQLLYGVDSDGDGAANFYVAANSPSLTDWKQVVSVRVSLVAVSPESGATVQGQTYIHNTGSAVLPSVQTATDRRLRQVFTTTIAIRNRLS